jgi:hypothetical protein
MGRGAREAFGTLVASARDPDPVVRSRVGLGTTRPGGTPRP